MSAVLQIEKPRAKQPAADTFTPPLDARPFYSIRDLADRWRCSRASVYNALRGHEVVDFAARGRKGHKIVPLEVVMEIERAGRKVFR
jgi:hypothetical protein